MKIPQALADLLNKTDEGFICFAFMWPAKVIRVIAKKDFTTFRVERFTRTNTDNADPKGSWHTLSTHGSETPGMMLDPACKAMLKAQKDFIGKLTKRMAPTPDQVKQQILRTKQ